MGESPVLGQDGQNLHYHHHINIRGVVMPTWVAVVLAIMGFGASLVILLAVLVFKGAADGLADTQTIQTKEIRMLGVNIQDIENLLIRSGIATRSDFAPRAGAPGNSKED